MTRNLEPLHVGPAWLPAGVWAHGLRLDPDVDAALEELRSRGLSELPETLAKAVPERRLSFLAGRYCARQALRECAPELADRAIAIGPKREPLWPEGIVGSIAHTRGYVIAAVARDSVAVGIGVDVERWMNDSAPARLAGYLSAEDGELTGLEKALGWPSHRALTLLFSAKEAFFKCLFPQVRQYFGFRDARVVAGAAAASVTEGSFTIELIKPLDTIPAGLALEGRFECFADVVVTALAPARLT